MMIVICCSKFLIRCILHSHELNGIVIKDYYRYYCGYTAHQHYMVSCENNMMLFKLTLSVTTTTTTLTSHR